MRRNKMIAVRHAAASGLFKKSSLADGLRAVNLFEELNGCAPDMSNQVHRMLIANTGWHFALARRLNMVDKVLK